MKLTVTARTTLIIALCLFSIVMAEERPAAMGQAEPATAETNDVKFPYIGEVTGVEINVRSGPGMNFYSSGKISAPLRVIVVGQKYIWSKILPPPGSFSWIFKQYVQVDPNLPDIGVVAADNVRVYAGADDRDPMRSDSVQILLPKGQKVRILGQAVGDYYKISPPEGACLWTSNQYIKFVRNADELEMKLPDTKQAPVEEAKPNLLIEQIEAKSQSSEKYYDLEKQFQDEKLKPLDKQDYSQIKAGLEKLVADEQSGDAGNYAKYLLKEIARCELALQAGVALQEDNEELNKSLIEIEESYKKKQQNITDLGKYAIMGTFKPSIVYETQTVQKRFLVLDDKQNPICYAEPVGEIAVTDFESYYEKKVGLIGRIEADKQSNLALVKFKKIELLEKKKAEEPKETVKEVEKAEESESKSEKAEE